ncbi:hypothetical protein PybrP1_006120 [[Pythium] brassicae (nom. inval.)]|nr:hypothetical protein PybrP1_006120 [[Pythium] brassicae (nom. inval.)]
MASPSIPPEVQNEITRLKNEVLAKDETLNQLKFKTKSFVDNMRGELAAEKKKVGDLEEQLRRAKDASAGGGNSASQAPAELTGELEALKKEVATVTHRENELKAKAKAFADSMKAQLQAEKDKSHKLEQDLKDKVAALALAQASVASSSASHDLLSLGDPLPCSKKDEEFSALQSQLQAAQHELAAMGDRMRNADDLASHRAQEATRAQAELDALRAASEQQTSRLQTELITLKTKESELESLLSSQKSSLGTADAAARTEEHSRLEEAISKNEEMSHQFVQYKIENEHLQKQLQDKDFLLEHLDNYRQRADESEDKARQLSGELASLQVSLQVKADEAAKSCAQCDELRRELAEITALYEKVNIGRSQSDIQLAEAQSALSSLQSVQQSYAAAKERVDELSKQNMGLNEAIFRKESETNALRVDVHKLTADVASLQDQVSASRSDSSSRRQQSEAAAADKQKTEATLRDVQGKYAQLETKNQELLAALDAMTKDTAEKRQKAKALVIALTNEKQSLADARSELQREVERLRMELNQRNVETERRLKQLNDENSQRIAASSSNIQGLSDEVATLKQTLAIVQESEKNQQRAKELANAKREVEDANKKRLAAKAETQKLAVELEGVHKCLAHLSEHANANCVSSARKMTKLQDRVGETLHVLEKRAQAAAGGKKAPAAGNQSEIEVEDLREPESASSSRDRPTSPVQSAKKAEENIAGVNERLTLLVDAAEKLCDMALEQNEVNLKDVVVDKVTQLFTQCFSEKLRSAYARVDEPEFLAPASNQRSSSHGDAKS